MTDVAVPHSVWLGGRRERRSDPLRDLLFGAAVVVILIIPGALSLAQLLRG